MNEHPSKWKWSVVPGKGCVIVDHEGYTVVGEIMSRAVATEVVRAHNNEVEALDDIIREIKMQKRNKVQ